MTDIIGQSLRQSWTNFVDALALYLPRVLAMLIVMVVGWLVAVVVAFIVRQLLGWLQLNRLVRRIGAEDLLKNLGLPVANVLAGSIAFWLVWAGFLFSAVDVLGFAGMESLVVAFLHFVPRLVVAGVILLLGFVAANFVWRTTLLAAVNAQLPSARLLSGAVRFLIVILTVAMALEQIAVATTIVATAFAIAFGAVMLGLAIAFGVGGGQIARRILEQHFPEREPPESGGASHL